MRGHRRDRRHTDGTLITEGGDSRIINVVRTLVLFRVVSVCETVAIALLRRRLRENIAVNVTDRLIDSLSEIAIVNEVIDCRRRHRRRRVQRGKTLRSFTRKVLILCQISAACCPIRRIPA